ncbi:tail fiber assembly protein [Salmonella enterica]|nr:tail fiber assembly protein [Salmonella enterica]
MNIVNIWNYLSDTKRLISKSNAIEGQLPLYCTTIEPPEIPEGKEAVFDEKKLCWNIWDITTTVKTSIIKVYGYTPDTLIFTSTADAIADSLPPNCTTVEPGTSPDEGYVLTFNIQGQSWQEMVDHRGETVYSTEDASPVSITRPGPYPDNTTTLTPDVPYPVWNGEGWITDTAAQNAANTQENIRIYKELMHLVALAQCPLVSASVLGMAPTDEQTSTLTGLREYAVTLTEFIQTADLTQNPLSFPVAEPGLLDYPIR